MSTDRHKTATAWRRGIDYYSELADYCMYQWSGDHGGPPGEMIELAESIVGDRLDEMIASFMTEA